MCEAELNCISQREKTSVYRDCYIAILLLPCPGIYANHSSEISHENLSQVWASVFQEHNLELFSFYYQCSA